MNYNHELFSEKVLGNFLKDEIQLSFRKYGKKRQQYSYGLVKLSTQINYNCELFSENKIQSSFSDYSETKIRNNS